MNTPITVKEMLYKMENRNRTPFELGYQSGLDGEHPENYESMSYRWKQGHLKGCIERGKKQLRDRL
jgi:hypothetical protein